MKKLTTILIICFMCTMANVSYSSDVRTSPQIHDELVESDDFNPIVPVYVNDKKPIVDDLMEQSYQTDGDVIKLRVEESDTYTNIITDELINDKYINANKNIQDFSTNGKEIIVDHFAQKYIDASNLERVKKKDKYDFTKKHVRIKLQLVNAVTTKKKLKEGDEILFRTVEDITIKDRVIKKGTEVIGRVETISPSDKMGTPFNLVIDNFCLKDDHDICFYGCVKKTGANRSYWVYPLYQAGNITFYAAGFVFVPIHGGHAKISTTETFTVFYEDIH